MSSGSSSYSPSSRSAYQSNCATRPSALASQSQSRSGRSGQAGASSTGVSAVTSTSVATPTFTTSISGVPSTALTAQSASPPSSTPLDIGPPGWTATIRLWEGTDNERTIYLGPWQLVGGAHHRRILWQCSYRGESIEHYLPENHVFPHTLHRNHREFAIPNELEQFVRFLEPHRIRYRDASGALLHNSYVPVQYEFSGSEVSYQFQGDIRGKDLVDYFDVDCVYSDLNARQNSYGAVAGLGTIQRMKLWKDRYALYYSMSFLANRREPRRHHEYQTHMFDVEIRSVYEQHRRLRLYVRGRRGSASPGQHGPRFNNPFNRSRQRSVGTSSHSSESEPSLPFRYLGIQFTNKEDFHRFQTRWAEAHEEGADFHGVPFPPNYIELPGACAIDENAYEMEGGVPNGDVPTL